MSAARTWRAGVAALVVALGVACAVPPRPITYEPDSDMPRTADGLHRVRATRVGAAFVKPGARFADYDRVVIDPVTIDYSLDPEEAGGDPARGYFAPSEATFERMKRIFQEGFEREIGRSAAYAVASEAGPGALRVTGRIVDLGVDVPPWHGGEVHFVLDAGAMTLVLDVRDSVTGEPLARIADRRVIRPESSGILGGFESNAVNSWGAVREIFAAWARLLRERLDDLRALPVPPAPEAVTQAYQTPRNAR